MKNYETILKPIKDRLQTSEHVDVILLQLVIATILDPSKASDLAQHLRQNETRFHLLGIYLNKDELVEDEVGIYVNDYGYLFDTSTAYIFNNDEVDSVKANDTATVYAFNESEIIALRESKVHAYQNSYVIAHHDSYIDVTDKSVADIYNSVRFRAAGESIIIMESKDSNKGIALEQASITYNPSEIKQLLKSRNYILQ